MQRACALMLTVIAAKMAFHLYFTRGWARVTRTAVGPYMVSR